MVTERIHPALITPPHNIEPGAKLDGLIDSMRRDGWTGRPLLLVNGDAWTGSHRIAAALAAGLEEVPCLTVEISPEALADFGPISDDDDRLALLESVFGLEANEAAWLMVTEIANTYITTCPTCSVPHLGECCDNPGCPESGNVTRAAWDAAKAKAEAERFARLRATSLVELDKAGLLDGEKRALRAAEHAALGEEDQRLEWSGHPDPDDPDRFWVDDDTGERVSAETGERFARLRAASFSRDSKEPETTTRAELLETLEGKWQYGLIAAGDNGPETWSRSFDTREEAEAAARECGAVDIRTNYDPFDDEAARRRVCLKHALRRAGLTWPSAATTDEDWLRAIAESHGVAPLTWSEIKQRREARP